MTHTEAPRRTRRRRADGERSRRAIVRAAADLATVEGLDGLSIGRLAAHIGMSKSGLYAHFGSKEELELATIEAAEQIFADVVVRPALELPPGRDRILVLCDRFLAHVERRDFPGGCFFSSVSAEFDGRPEANPVRARCLEVIERWIDLIEASVAEAQHLGEVDAPADAAQVAFELNALLGQANSLYVLYGDPLVLERARAGIRARLGLRGA